MRILCGNFTAVPNDQSGAMTHRALPADLNCARMIDYQLSTTKYQLSGTGHVTNKIYADGRGMCYNYSEDGKFIERKWARGVTTTYAYDGWNNLTNTTYSDGTPSVAFAYDALGRRTAIARSGSLD